MEQILISTTYIKQLYIMHLGPNNILKDMRKHKPMHYKPKKQNSREKAKKKKKI